MASIPSAYHDLFEKATFAHLTTMTPDGERLLINTERGRRKERNVANDPTVAVSMVDPDNPYSSP